MIIDIDNIPVNYFDMGQGDTTVVMLHGWGSNIGLFEPSATSVASKYRVVAPDMPGAGQTPEPPGEWTVDDYTDFVAEFITAIGLKKIILLGHSFGGRVIIKLANRENLPFEISKIILVDSAGIKPHKSAERKMFEKAGKVAKKLLSVSPKAVEKFQEMFGSEDYVNASPLMKKILINVVNEDLTHLLPGIKQSTLLIWGDYDTATPIEDAKKMEELIPDAGLAVIPGTGHFSFIQNPSLYNAILSSFLGL